MTEYVLEPYQRLTCVNETWIYNNYFKPQVIGIADWLHPITISGGLPAVDETEAFFV